MYIPSRGLTLGKPLILPPSIYRHNGSSFHIPRGLRETIVEEKADIEVEEGAVAGNEGDVDMGEDDGDDEETTDEAPQSSSGLGLTGSWYTEHTDIVDQRLDVMTAKEVQWTPYSQKEIDNAWISTWHGMIAFFETVEAYILNNYFETHMRSHAMLPSTCIPDYMRWYSLRTHLGYRIRMYFPTVFRFRHMVNHTLLSSWTCCGPYFDDNDPSDPFTVQRFLEMH
ncbi:hypothetical protein M9H77_07739 [Catharanthus roseus]|uniref:Uncharacterized protein n=1 Tax=Catharanthus roseus TaxID=4058 RepID=A0ACC0BVS4_CATRO|nr:hypothetical protein M9H77_07739 [Catharanthus roseus]